jgi:integrase
MEDRQKLLEELNRETEYYSPHTRQQYFSHLNNYLNYVGEGDWKDRDILYAYAKKLRKQHSQKHVNYIVRGPIGALFRAYELRMPIKLPRVQVSSVIHELTEGIQFTAEEIERLIQGALMLSNPEHLAAMAIATTYGPRVSEIAHIEPKDVHPNKKLIVIHTMKYGLKREHHVPEQIAPYVFGFDYPFASVNRLYKVFDDVRQAANIPRVERKNYHAIRHGLCTELIHGAKIRESAVYMFLRWRGSGMLATYAPYHPGNDEEVFEKHLFLPCWE